MVWQELEEHFRAATKQDACEFGDDAIEWDHSRYSRALGLVGDSSLQQRRHAGIALLSSQPVAWNRAAERYGRMAETMGWSLLRISARPTVAVPDPVVHELGSAVAGRNGLIFMRSGRGRRPRVLPGRARPAGASLPLRPADRWLIAADRVRRRVRNEAAERGLLLFVEDAHKLTASAMSILAYFADAHCAWQARMLARDALIYIVLVTPPEHQEPVREMLTRFSLGDGVLVARELPSRVASPRPNGLGVEEEYLHAALNVAPLALAEEDIASIFGDSALVTVARLVESGAVRERWEDGKTCFVPVPGLAEDVPAAPRRVIRALLDRYRERLRTGHEHLLLAMAALAFRLGEPLRALAYLGRVAPGNTATVAADLGEELDSQLRSESVGHLLRGGHLAAWACMRAHQRDYKAAQELASRLTTIDLRSQADFGRVLSQLLACGRTHTDEMLAPEFWASLRSSGVDPSLFDAACIFAELELRGRHMPGEEIANRYRVAAECLSAANTDPARCARSSTRSSVRGFPKTIGRRFQGFVELHYRAGKNGGGVAWERVEGCGVLPGYLLGSAYYGHYYADRSSVVKGNRVGMLCRATELLRSTGNCHDSLVVTGAWLREFTHSGLVLLGRQLADEAILLVPRDASFRARYRVARVLSNLAGPRTRLLTSAALAAAGLQSLRGRVSDGSLELATLARDLLSQGDFVGSASALKSGLGGSHRYPVRLANLLQLQVYSALETLSWEDLEVCRVTTSRYSQVLPGWLLSIVQAYVEGAQLLVQRRPEQAVAVLDRVLDATRDSRSVSRALLASVRALLVTAKRLGKWRDTLAGTFRDHQRLRLFSRLFLSPLRGVQANVGSPIPDRLFAVAIALEEWATSQAMLSRDHAVLLALWLRGRVGRAFEASQGGFCGALIRCAPSYSKQLVAALPNMSSGDPAALAAAALAASLASVQYAWNLSSLVLPGTLIESLTSYSLAVRVRGSARRVAKAASGCWPEDASVHARCVTHVDAPQHLSCFGQHEGCALGSGVRIVVTSCGTGVVMTTHAPPSPTPMPRFVATGGVALPHGGRSAACEASTFLGSSQQAEEVRDLIEIAARCEYPVLIDGETGTGKEVVARSVHHASRRGVKLVVIADCATATDSLLESELFGHTRGAFTGAHDDHDGVVSRAHGSTLFLDEVDSMTTRMQSALLRVIETGEYRRVGCTQRQWSDFRVISASRTGLQELVELGSFREDLYYRLSTLRIPIPPLRRRVGDAVEIAVQHARRAGYRIMAPALALIDEYGWPGNVRQLKHCLDFASVMTSDSMIGIAAMESAIGRQRGPSVATCRPAPTAAQRVWQSVLPGLAGADFTVQDFVEVAAVSRRSAQRHLAALVRVGLVRRHGAGRTTAYSVTGAERRRP